MENKEIVLKFDSLEIIGDISVGDIVAMFAAGLQQVCDILEKDLGNNNEDFNYALGMLIHSIIAGKTDKEIAKILTQTELIRRDYKKFMENNKEN
jgi:hypothetical protein